VEFGAEPIPVLMILLFYIMYNDCNLRVPLILKLREGKVEATLKHGNAFYSDVFQVSI